MTKKVKGTMRAISQVQYAQAREYVKNYWEELSPFNYVEMAEYISTSLQFRISESAVARIVCDDLGFRSRLAPRGLSAKKPDGDSVPRAEFEQLKAEFEELRAAYVQRNDADNNNTRTWDKNFSTIAGMLLRLNAKQRLTHGEEKHLRAAAAAHQH